MMISCLRYPLVLLLPALMLVSTLRAQEKPHGIRCATMEVINKEFRRNPNLKTSFDRQTQRLQKATSDRKAQQQAARILGSTVYVPIVFHIVLSNPNSITNAQVQAQVDQLNTDFAGLNGDTTMIPAAFKGRFAKTQIQFKLAQRTPDDEPSNGIERVVGAKTQYSIDDPSLKYTVQGGADAWDHDRFFNVWITSLADNYLGYSTFPNMGNGAEDGVAIHYTSLPGGQPPYNKGRTLVHESGHYFNLFHIWGDENFCNGTDFIDDTPNQATFTNDCPGGVPRTDMCTTTAPGILYEDFMDYTDDACMVMFTRDQVDRMETALSIYRASLFTSNGADPVVLFPLDAAAKSINAPTQRVCAAIFSPVITLRNRGTQVLTAATIYALVDNNNTTKSTTQWTGNLASLAETPVTLNALTTTEGVHTLTVIISAPNSGTDNNPGNDTLSIAFQYHQPVTTPLVQSFESSTFPPPGWDIINPDHSYTWERVSTVGHQPGQASVMMRNYEYTLNGQKDYLRLPSINITNADSAFMTFYVAAAVTTNPEVTNNPFDTLQVWVSTDCGVTNNSLYKKWGSNLITRSGATADAFVPTDKEWRKDSVNLTPYIGKGPVLLSFVNTAEYENNIYLDDINVYSVAYSANLKEKGFMITPNPTSGLVTVQFYPYAAELKGINIFNMQGQKVAAKMINGPGSSGYGFDLSPFASGVYIVQVVMGNKVITQKVIKN